MFRFMTVAFAAVLAVAFVGCATEGTRVPTDVEAVPTHDFNPTDLQIIADKSVKDLMAQTGNIFPEGQPPAVYVARIRNLTDEHLQTDMLAQRVAVRLSESGKIRLIARSEAFDEAVKELEFQRGAFVNPETTRKTGKMIGASYFVQGELSNLVSEAGWKKAQYFQFTLSLVDIETLLIWKSQVDVQKVSKRGLFGW